MAVHRPLVQMSLSLAPGRTPHDWEAVLLLHGVTVSGHGTMTIRAASLADAQAACMELFLIPTSSVWVVQTISTEITWVR